VHLGYWRQRADERHDNPPARQPGAFNGHRQSRKTADELGVSRSSGCDTFPFSAYNTDGLGDREVIRPAKSWMLVCWW